MGIYFIRALSRGVDELKYLESDTVPRRQPCYLHFLELVAIDSEDGRIGSLRRLISHTIISDPTEAEVFAIKLGCLINRINSNAYVVENVVLILEWMLPISLAQLLSIGAQWTYRNHFGPKPNLNDLLKVLESME